VVAELGEAVAFDVEGARFAAVVSGAGSVAAVPCRFCCGGAAVSLCVFDKDDGVCAGVTLVLLAEIFVVGVW